MNILYREFFLKPHINSYFFAHFSFIPGCFRGSGGVKALIQPIEAVFCLKKCLKSPYNTMDGNYPICFNHKEVLCNIVLFGSVGTSC